MGHWNHIVATAATNGRIALYDLNAPSAKTEWAWLHEHTGQINKLGFDPHAGFLLLSAGQDKSVRLWDLRDSKPEKSHSRFEVRSPIRDVRWCPVDAFDFATCADGGVIQKWDARAPKQPKLSINAHEKACYSIDYHPDGRHVISGGFDKYIRVWDFDTERKRQKPILQLKAPHAIKNIRWRPACSISESDESGMWQSTQVAVSYYHDDPRIHIWDLRRPLVPFRELDRYNSAANDFLWAEKDLLWTVGDEGIFTQWDVKHTSPFYDQLAPGASHFEPDGRHYTFSEDRQVRRASSYDDTEAGFLSVPRDKLSSGEEVVGSRSLSDDEDVLETTTGTSSRRREAVAPSTKSNKSQTNSPPSVDGKPTILSLDQAVLMRPDAFANEQLGVSGCIVGIAADSEVVEYLALHYATPSTADEDRSSPETILHRLESALHQNAVACDMVAMHRMAQTWRILAAVIVPELKDWADSNRAKRRADATRRKETLESFRTSTHRPGLSPLPGLPHQGQTPKYDGKGHKLISSLFKGTADGDRARSGLEVDSTSNMTTPLVKPLPNSPPTGDKRWAQVNLDDALDSLPPLPPSMLNSHSTAAAAARALIGSPDRAQRSDTASPELRGPNETTQKESTVKQAPDSPSERPKSDRSGQQKRLPSQNQTQEDRRAALRDYRVQARPILSLGDSRQNDGSSHRNDSAESFPMFSVSTDSSQKIPSMEQSFESTRDGRRVTVRRLASDLSSENDDDTDGSYSHQPHSKSDQQRQPNTVTRNLPTGVSATDTTPDLSFESDSDAMIPGLKAAEKWPPIREHDYGTASHLGTAVSSSPDIFHFEAVMPKHRIHTSNPMRSEIAPLHGETNVTAGAGAGALNRLSLDELDSKTYLYHDFRPIDLSRYEPSLPFAWSSLPLICQCISFDLENGIAHAQFAVHLLMHVHRYFFHASFRDLQHGESKLLDNVADRLMSPQLGHRIIGSVFENHLAFLSQMGFFESAALLRKMCVEFEYPQISRPSSDSRPAGGSLTGGDRSLVSVVCTNCHGPMSAGKDTCERCRWTRTRCSICQSLEHGYERYSNSNLSDYTRPWGQKNQMWMCCQACGHGGHVQCLTEWFHQSFSDGTCPTPGCGCDCGPGLTRKTRLLQQIKREDEAKLIRGSSPGQGTSGTKRDPLRVAHSPAVDKVRRELRTSVGGERSTQSGDERSLPGERGVGHGRASGFTSSRKSVRLITPAEEDGRSQAR